MGRRVDTIRGGHKWHHEGGARGTCPQGKKGKKKERNRKETREKRGERVTM